jgi:hypothetical protein
VYGRFVMRIRDEITPPVAGFRTRLQRDASDRESARLHEFVTSAVNAANAKSTLAGFSDELDKLEGR